MLREGLSSWEKKDQQRPEGHLASTMLVCRLQAPSFPPTPCKAKERLTRYSFPLEIACSPVLSDPKVASYLPNLWCSSYPFLRPHSKTLPKIPFYCGMFAHQKYQNLPIPHSLMAPSSIPPRSDPHSTTWHLGTPPPLGPNLLYTLQ